MGKYLALRFPNDQGLAMSPFGKINDRDTRAILCNTDATTQPLTANHHADERTEETRLRRVGGGIITDSFGDTRWMGALANTRWWVRANRLGIPCYGELIRSLGFFSLGDSQYKRFGVTPEPDVKTRIIAGHSATALVLMSDGISSLLSDPEIADLVRTCAKLGPEVAAREIVRFAEELGAEDNCTAVVVPLKGWNTRVKDTTKVTRPKRCHASSGIDKVVGTPGVSADGVYEQ